MAYRESAELGSFGEKVVTDLFETGGIKCEKNSASGRSQLIEFDLKCTLENKVFTVECKFDAMARKSGNIAIEYYNTRQSKPSGIKATKADLWVVVLRNPQDVFLTSVKLLTGYCESNRPHKNIASGGDNNSAMWLYRMENILPVAFFPLDGLKPEELQEIIFDLLG